MKWYALHVKPHKERTVTELLQSRDVEVFFPRLKVKPVNPRSAKERPFLPGYLFVHVDLETAGTDAFRWLPGAHRLVQVGGETAVVPDAFITELQGRLAEIQKAGGINLAEIKQGDKVCITEGPLAGYDAVFDAYLPGKQRVQVLLAFLSNQPQPVKLNSEMIKKK
ncbi:MAG: hypothetical protein CSB13_09435 [Chloroflexi bacterium]|nr:MAG: hypothetical protein CSB13_09435 [Chloroflexota bacterium]